LVSEKHADAIRIWQHHERSRHAGMPIVSVWIGDADECEQTLRSSARELVWSNGANLHQVARDWWREIAARRDLLSEAFGFIARAIGGLDSELRASWMARGLRERQMWLAELGNRDLADVVELLRSTLDSREEIADYPSALRRLLAWLPSPECLALRNIAALREVLALTVASPALAVVACLDRTSWLQLLPQLDDRSRTLLEQGVIVRQSRPDVIAVTAVEQHAREAYTEARLARERRAEDAKELASRARSAAEQRLYELLQADPITSGLFELNVKMPFSFGPGRAEVDLACIELRVAVEVDGFHHFREFDAYRRDRRKDVLLQHQGYLVSRHLADDVMERASDVVRSIREVVKRRRRQRR
jgi:very-short-patch-repair endonuclease